MVTTIRRVRMKKKTSNGLLVILFLAGLSLLLYPFIANEWNTYRQSKLINIYEQVLEEKIEEIDYSTEWDRANQFNQDLLPSILPDSFAIAAASDEPDKEYMACLNLTDDGMMGFVEIPKINIKVPIYHTVSDEVLQKAAGHLEGSSLPVGGENTHAVISAHRGLPSAALFTDLDRLKEGDHFLIHVLDKTLSYEVDKITVVEPEDTDALAVIEGEDYVTLLTCTPYGVNSHRLLVRGHQVPYESEVIEKEENVLNTSLHTNYLLWVIVGLGITGGFIVALFVLESKRRKRIAVVQVLQQESLDLDEVPEEDLNEEDLKKTEEKEQ